ncbi:uncharacterized protein LOC111022574 [Momordica charantia]|uniref:Uncharacterized protein LOC111022574 n=1 Tax=Momordica charantia TaxID=3673 RepID=A0A6J1DPB9_MOMCH|nr:uncharacterized protein LOC111022574 [Momordica charantia]
MQICPLHNFKLFKIQKLITWKTHMVRAAYLSTCAGLSIVLEVRAWIEFDLDQAVKAELDGREVLAAREKEEFSAALEAASSTMKDELLRAHCGHSGGRGGGQGRAIEEGRGHVM